MKPPSRLDWGTSGHFDRVLLLAATFLCRSSHAIFIRSNRSASRAILRDAYEVTLTNYNNVQYSAPFNIGSQTLPVIYDTGSFEIIVLSTLCEACARDHPVYDSRRSGSFISEEGVTAEHLFGSGPIRSQKAFETVSVGDASSPLSVQHAPFWQVVSHDISVWNENAHFSGIVGLGHLDYIPEGFGGDAYERTLLASLGVNRFAICLGRDGPSSPGQMLLWRNAAAMPGQFRSLQVHGEIHWGVKMTDLQVPGLTGPRVCSPSCGAIVDSGTSLIAAPPSASGLVDILSNMVAKDCSNLHQLPVLRLRLEGMLIELPPRAYVMQVTHAEESSGSSTWRALFGEPRHKQECSAAFMMIDKDSSLGPVWILGMPFLRYYHTVFDRAGKRLFVAPSAPNCAFPGSGAGGWGTVAAAVVDGQAQESHNANATKNAAFRGGSGVSASGGGAHANLGGASRLFTSADFEPTQVDIKALRFPPWAGIGTNNSSEHFLKM